MKSSIDQIYTKIGINLSSVIGIIYCFSEMTELTEKYFKEAVPKMY